MHTERVKVMYNKDDRYYSRDNDYSHDLYQLMEQIELLARLRTDEDPYARDNEQLRDWRNRVVETRTISDNITLKLLSPLPTEKIDTLVKTVRSLNKVAPAPGNVEILAPASRSSNEDGATSRANADGIVGQNVDEDIHRVMLLSDSVLNGNEDAYRENLKANPFVFMPSSKNVSNMVYTIAHEWGHVIDTRARTGNETSTNVMQKVSVTGGLFKFITSMSQYGATGEPEAFAESFTEWFLTNGETNNFASNWYAKEYGWRTA